MYRSLMCDLLPRVQKYRNNFRVNIPTRGDEPLDLSGSGTISFQRLGHIMSVTL